MDIEAWADPLRRWKGGIHSVPDLRLSTAPGSAGAAYARRVKHAKHSRFLRGSTSPPVIEVVIEIPRGIDEGNCVRLSGEGEPGVNGGPAGDLYVQVQIKQHPVFQRDHDDLHCEMPVSFATAALGGEIEIPTLDGSARIKVPAETQSGRVFRLRGKGIVGVRSRSAGDLFCHVVVETPVKLTERQKELLREFESISQEDTARHNPAASPGWRR